MSSHLNPAAMLRISFLRLSIDEPGGVEVEAYSVRHSSRSSHPDSKLTLVHVRWEDSLLNRQPHELIADGRCRRAKGHHNAELDGQDRCAYQGKESRGAEKNRTALLDGGDQPPAFGSVLDSQNRDKR